MTDEELQCVIDNYDASIQALTKARNELQRHLTRKAAFAWIHEHNCRLEDIHVSGRDGVPSFNVSPMFTKWLTSQKKPKPFCEWNTRIFLTKDVIRDDFDFRLKTATVDDVKAYWEQCRLANREA